MHEVYVAAYSFSISVNKFEQKRKADHHNHQQEIEQRDEMVCTDSKVNMFLPLKYKKRVMFYTAGIGG